MSKVSSAGSYEIPLAIPMEDQREYVGEIALFLYLFLGISYGSLPKELFGLSWYVYTYILIETSFFEIILARFGDIWKNLRNNHRMAEQSVSPL